MRVCRWQMKVNQLFPCSRTINPCPDVRPPVTPNRSRVCGEKLVRSVSCGACLAFECGVLGVLGVLGLLGVLGVLPPQFCCCPSFRRLAFRFAVYLSAILVSQISHNIQLLVKEIRDGTF